MSIFQKVVFGLLLVFNGHSYALEPSGSAGPQCPSQDFSDFLRAFGESVEIQKAFTRYPLKKWHLDINAESEPKPIFKSLGKSQIDFPLIPNAIERKRINLDIWVDGLSEKHAEATLRRRDGDLHATSFFFSKTGCWTLTKIEDWFIPASHQSSWLVNIFPRIKACTPTNLYYDRDTKASVNNYVEHKGYKNPKLDNVSATYAIQEKFYTLDAKELSIPSGSDSIYTVTVLASSQQLASKIFEITGQKIDVSKGKPAQSGKAYLISEGKNQSKFVCFTFEEGL